jgi:phage tail sheath protein FI
MPIYAAGSINTTALIVPGLYVQITPPQQLALNGVPSNVIGVVGTAQWGPKNTATIVGNMAQYSQNFGSLQNRLYDMGTVVAAAVLQGASSFKCVRITDGTDVAATSAGVATCSTFTAIYSGTLGNSLVAAIAAGSRANTFKFTIGLPGLLPEIYDNISGTGNAFWVALATAINSGTSSARGPSGLITATAAAGTTAPIAASFSFTGGTDGVTTITSTVQIGTDGLTRTGMYALRGSGCSLGVIADCTTSTAWTTIDGFGLSEGIYMIQVAPPGSVISNGTTGTVDLKNTAGLDSYSSKLLHGDWIWWNDTANNVIRLISPQGFAAGRLGNLSPQNSSLNKPIYGVVGTQKSGIVGSQQQQVYSQADLSALIGAGADVIMNPSAGGFYWGAAAGHNASSNAGINGDNYTRMTNYIAATLSAGMGYYVGLVINTALMQNVTATLMSFFANLLQQGLLSGLNGLPYSVVCNLTNNPLSRTSLGYLQADCSVQYMAINEKFIVNLTGGTTVVVQLVAAPSA